MQRRHAVGVGLIAVALIGAWQEATEPQVDFIDITNFPEIELVFTPPAEFRDVEVTDVTLLQDGVAVPVEFAGLETEPLELALLMDTSGSMVGEPIAAARSAAIEFVDQVPAGSEIALISFGDEVTIVTEFDSPRTDLIAAIANLTVQGETALHDAIAVAVDLVETAPRSRQFVVLLSDGGDTVSEATLDDAVEALGREDIGFHAIALEGTEYDPAALIAMSTAAGGDVVSASDASGLSSIYASIAAELVSQHRLRFEATDGGLSRFDLTIETPLGSGSTSFAIDLPALAPPPGSVASTTTVAFSPGSAPAAIVSPPPSAIVSPPGPLQQRWAMVVGVAALSLVMLVTFAMALRPVDRASKRRGLTDSPDAPPRVAARLGARAGSRVEGLLTGGGSSKVADALETAGVALRPGEFVVAATIAIIGALGLGAMTGNFALTALMAVTAAAAPNLWLQLQTRRRQTAFADQLDSTIQLISGSLKAGYGIEQAINTVATEAEEPTRQEFTRVAAETRMGRQLSEALGSLANRMDNSDFRWLTDAIDIQREVGGDLAEVLDTIGATIRDRNQLRRQVQALSAEGRISAIILIALPFVMAALLAVTNPGYLDELTGTAVGRWILLAGVGLMGVGMAWIRKIIDIKY
jgi:tight adherence protein B